MISVLADQNLYHLDRFIPPEASLDTFNPEKGLPDDWHRYQALLIRTVTDIDESLFSSLDHCAVQFIGSGSAGFDHVDLSVLENRGIEFAHAPGCNARSVAEYVITALLLWAEQNRYNLQNFEVGIVGVGHVGTALSQLLDALDIPQSLYDPPREEREAEFHSCSLSTLLNADILSFHTPLTRSGPHPTHKWLDEEKLAGRHFKLVLNTARGGIIEETDLLKYYQEEDVEDYGLDVWQNEPSFNDAIAQSALFKTPHIAGYSHQAKLRASQMITASMARHFNVTEPPSLSPDTDVQNDDPLSSNVDHLAELLTHIHPLTKYQSALDQLIGLPAEEKERRFSKIRTGRAYRDEYRYMTATKSLIKQFPILRKLGIAATD